MILGKINNIQIPIVELHNDKIQIANDNIHADYFEKKYNVIQSPGEVKALKPREGYFQ